ncbi:DUF4397 domain-containing protein [Mucilaginibacter aquaedulcis]|uniref:DUF4397 domain-containing protein n=1 Tax=Mucilaginibacter aquaedulcis TaxID=1187081 RepID=UPI0025B4CFE3|nr:DUF4397 domain-containing protein [Mucilaginibacter aquaedulcis]MDN3548835.1 DUF4397 domain-containing protein [Mucilaginibacter aquaedulcis]
MSRSTENNLTHSHKQMKRVIYSGITSVLLAIILVSCKKNTDTPIASSSLTIVNAIAGGSALVPNFNSGTPLIYYKTAQQIAANSFIEFSGFKGDIPLAVSLLSDTTHTIYNQTIHLSKGGISTLFLTGTTTNAVPVLITDDIKPVTDSAVSVRFINLSNDSAPVSINITGSQNAPVVSSLAYKAVSPFQLFTVKRSTPASDSYSFEIRDAASAKLLTTYTLTGLMPGTTAGKLFKNVTVVFKGVPGGSSTSTQGAILVNNY